MTARAKHSTHSAGKSALTALLRRRALATPTDGTQQPEDFIPFEADQVEQSIPARFEEQVRRHGERLAIKTRRQELTYAALNRRANRIAHGILRLGGAQQEPVVLLVDKEIGYFAAIFGALKAGKIYVPLSPSDPAARQALLLEDCGAPLIVTDQHNVAAARDLADKSGLLVLNVDELEADLEQTNPDVAIAPHDCAYILYTSGTTGRPKGVVESHRNLLHNMLNYTNDHFLCASDRLICLGSCAFSNILKDIFGALLNGAALLSVDVQKEGLAGLGDWIATQGITVYNSVPTVLRHLVSSLRGNEDLSRVRLVRLGGEPVLRRDVELVRRHFSPLCALVNGYGATETGTATRFVAGPATAIPGAVVPIGHAVRGMEIVLLGDDNRPIEGEEVGQIAVRSRYLALGYWKRRDLTEAVFLPDPEGGDKRMYLTGDLARRLPDGALVCAGRKDFQVKVRGHRIELAEIELQLLDEPAVKEAAVVARPELRQDHCLVGYLVLQNGQQASFSVENLRRRLARCLPSYAVPSAFMTLPALPLSPNGKLDPRALPAPPRPGAESREGFVPPSNELEARLASLWCDVLDVPAVGRFDNFFELGGDSLAAAQLVIQIEKTFGTRLPMEALLQAATLEQLARRIAEKEAAQKRRCLVPLRAAGSKPPFFCVHAVGGEVVSYQRLAHFLGTDQPFYGFQAQGVGSSEKPLTRIEDLAATYVEELLAYQKTGPYCLGGHSCGGVIAYEMAQQLCRRGHEVGLLAVIDQRRPNLVPGSAWRLGRLGHWLMNLPYWLRDDILQTGPGELARRVRSKLGMVKRRLGSIILPSRQEPVHDVRDFFDVRRIPADYLGLLQANYRAVRNYVPQPYPGKMLLFRARTQPFLPGDWHKTDMGWGTLPRGGLEVVKLRGHHNSILRDPHVEELAGRLGCALAAARRRG